MFRGVVFQFAAAIDHFFHKLLAAAHVEVIDHDVRICSVSRQHQYFVVAHGDLQVAGGTMQHLKCGATVDAEGRETVARGLVDGLYHFVPLGERTIFARQHVHHTTAQHVRRGFRKQCLEISGRWKPKFVGICIDDPVGAVCFGREHHAIYPLLLVVARIRLGDMRDDPPFFFVTSNDVGGGIGRSVVRHDESVHSHGMVEAEVRFQEFCLVLHEQRHHHFRVWGARKCAREVAQRLKNLL